MKCLIFLTILIVVATQEEFGYDDFEDPFLNPQIPQDPFSNPQTPISDQLIETSTTFSIKTTTPSTVQITTAPVPIETTYKITTTQKLSEQQQQQQQQKQQHQTRAPSADIANETFPQAGKFQSFAFTSIVNISWT